MAEHPDKGGDPKKFQLLNKALFVQSNWNDVLELMVLLKFSLGVS